MKKVLILSIVAMFTAFSGFAATTASATWQSGDPNGSYVYDNSGSAPEITLSWDLSTSKVEFGFYTDDTLATPATGITIETEDSGTGIVGKGETYVGWKITGAAPVKLEIYASGAGSVAGFVFNMPVHATVIKLYSSGQDPQPTNIAGNG